MARLALVGVGAIGGALAAFLWSTKSHQILLCTRRPLQKLSVETPDGTVEVEALNLTDPGQAPAVDWVVVASKAYDAAGTAQWFPALCATGAPVAIVQNGVEHRERFQGYLEAERLLPVVIDCPVERPRDGLVRVRGAAQMKVEQTRLGANFRELFEGSGAEMELTADFTTAMWSKLCMNSVGALSALALKPSGVLRGEAMAQVALQMVAECAEVARAEGARIDSSIGEQVLANYARHPADSKNSLLADRLAGRRMEWDARNGAIVRKGVKHGIDTPMNRMAAALLEAVEGEPRLGRQG
jgi:2-dehydropantoate 2-reductase